MPFGKVYRESLKVLAAGFDFPCPKNHLIVNIARSFASNYRFADGGTPSEFAKYNQYEEKS